MSSKTYRIINWEGIISTGTTPLTSLTILPDLDLIRILERNTNNMLQIRISGTNSGYDNVWFGIFDKASNIPACRKNFFDLTGYWIVTINCPWIGPPNNPGQLTIVDGPYKAYEKDLKPSIIVKPTPLPNPTPTPLPTKESFKMGKENIDNQMLIYIAGIFILFSIVLLSIYILKKQK